jgi:tetratricopeptide (TPR) repeat protein
MLNVATTYKATKTKGVLTFDSYCSNRAAAYLHADKKNEKDEDRMSRLNKALIDAVKSTEGHPDFAKGHYRAGQALLELGRHLEAVAALNRARMCDPNNPQIFGALSHAQAALATAKKAKEEQTEEEKLKKEEEQNKKKKKHSSSGVMESAEAFAHAKTHDVNAAKSGSSISHQSASSHRAAERNQGGRNSQPAEGNTLERVCHPADTVGSKGKGKMAKAGGLWGDDSGVFGASGAGVREAEKAKEDGNKAFAKGEFGVAAEHFTLAINLDPSNHVYHANRSAALLKIGKLEESLEDAHTAIKINPMYAKGHLRKGQALAVIGRVDLAVASMEQAVKLDPSNESLQEALAGTKRMRAGVRGEGEEVESWCSDVSLGQIECEVPRQGRAGDHVTLTVNVPEYGPIKIDAQIPEGYKPGMKFQVDVGSPMDIAKTKKEEGIKAYRGGRMQKAVTDFSDSLHLNPRDAACFANRSASHYSLGKLEEALADAEQSILIEPSLHKGFLRKGLALAALCNFDAAVEALTKAHELCADDEAVLEALAEAKVDAAAKARGEQVSRDKREDDARKVDIGNVRRPHSAPFSVAH